MSEWENASINVLAGKRVNRENERMKDIYIGREKEKLSTRKWDINACER